MRISLPAPSEKAAGRVRKLAVITTIGMFLVVMMGSTVTNTGSAEGCGRSWPLCHGEFIPSYAFETAIEFGHRVITALEGFLVIATAIGAIWIYPGRRDVKVLVGVMIGTIVLQSGLGAMAVMWPQSPVLLATHFGISLVCLAAVFLLTRMMFGHRVNASQDAAPLPQWLRRATFLTVPLILVTGYVGAYMRHAGGELACSTWPLCNGEVFPGLTGSVGISFGHRLLALTSLLFLVFLAYKSHNYRADYPDLARTLRIAAIAIFGQALAGGFVVLTRLDVWTTLLHAGLMAVLFVALADAVWQVRHIQQLRNAVPASPSFVPDQVRQVT